jgi:hypothetical protein
MCRAGSADSRTLDAPFDIHSLRAPPVERSLPALYPELAAQLDSVLNGSLHATELSPGTALKVWWRCEHGHVWQARVNARVHGTGCPTCARNRVTPGRALRDKRPDLAKELHPERNPDVDPANLATGSNRLLWWRGACGHEWQARVFARANGSGCPVCSRAHVPATRSLAHRDAALAQELHPHRNVGLDPSALAARSNRLVWWRCSHGHEWEARVSDRAGGSACPYCYRQRRATGHAPR